MAYTESREDEIVGGPSKFDIMVSLFASPTNDSSPRVSFKLGNGTDISVSMLSVQREDGSGESWNLEGFATLLSGDQVFVKAYYSSRKRIGYIRINPSR